MKTSVKCSPSARTLYCIRRSRITLQLINVRVDVCVCVRVEEKTARKKSCSSVAFNEITILSCSFYSFSLFFSLLLSIPLSLSLSHRRYYSLVFHSMYFVHTFSCPSTLFPSFSFFTRTKEIKRNENIVRERERTTISNGKMKWESHGDRKDDDEERTHSNTKRMSDSERYSFHCTLHRSRVNVFGCRQFRKYFQMVMRFFTSLYLDDGDDDVCTVQNFRFHSSHSQVEKLICVGCTHTI